MLFGKGLQKSAWGCPNVGLLANVPKGDSGQKPLGNLEGDKAPETAFKTGQNSEPN